MNERREIADVFASFSEHDLEKEPLALWLAREIENLCNTAGVEIEFENNPAHIEREEISDDLLIESLFFDTKSGGLYIFTTFMNLRLDRIVVAAENKVDMSVFRSIIQRDKKKDKLRIITKAERYI